VKRPESSAGVGGAGGVVLASWFLGGLMLAFLIIPLISLAAGQSLARVAEIAAEPGVREAIGLSLVAAFMTAAIATVFGVPLAYLMTRTAFPGVEIVAAVVDLPLAVPHTVAGIALLLALGRRGLIGAPAETVGLRFWSTFAGVVAAMLFVSAPYAVNAARIGFEAVDPRLEKVARTLGFGPWRVLVRVTLPMAWRSVLAGATLTFARAISEFAAVAILAYYPITAPVKIYELFLQRGLSQAAAMSLLLLVISLALFILFRHASRRPIAPGVGR